MPEAEASEPRVGGVALAVTEEVAPQRMAFLTVTRAGGAGLTTAIVLAACYAVLARDDQPNPLTTGAQGTDG